MPRRPRVHVPGGFYHVILRGNHRKDIFITPADREAWERILADSVDNCGARIHAYCWMTNHVHMLIETGPVPLGKVIHRAAGLYSRWFQRQFSTTGHLFEKRYIGLLVPTDSYLLSLVRYIHRNPLRAGISTEIDGYRWSSHRQYLARASKPWLTTARILELLTQDPSRALRRYREFMEESDEPPEMQETSSPATNAIQVAEKSRESVVVIAPHLTLTDLAAAVAHQNDVTLQALKAPSRDRLHAQLRAKVVWRAVSEGIATVSEVARFFGRSPAAMSQAMKAMRERRAQPD